MPLDFKTPPRRAPRRPFRALLAVTVLSLASWVGLATAAQAVATERDALVAGPMVSAPRL